MQNLRIKMKEAESAKRRGMKERMERPEFAERREQARRILRAGNAISEDILRDGALMERLASMKLWRLKSMTLDLYVYENGLLEKHGVKLQEFLRHVRDLVHYRVDEGTHGELRLFCRFHSSNILKSVYEDVMFGMHTTHAWHKCNVDGPTPTLCSGGVEMMGIPSIRGLDPQPGCAAIKEKNRWFREDVILKIKEWNCTPAHERGPFRNELRGSGLFLLFDDREIDELKPFLPEPVVSEIDCIFQEIKEMSERILKHTTELIEMKPEAGTVEN